MTSPPCPDFSLVISILNSPSAAREVRCFKTVLSGLLDQQKDAFSLDGNERRAAISFLKGEYLILERCVRDAQHIFPTPITSALVAFCQEYFLDASSGFKFVAYAASLWALSELLENGQVEKELLLPLLEFATKRTKERGASEESDESYESESEKVEPAKSEGSEITRDANAGPFAESPTIVDQPQPHSSRTPTHFFPTQAGPQGEKGTREAQVDGFEEAYEEEEAQQDVYGIGVEGYAAGAGEEVHSEVEEGTTKEFVDDEVEIWATSSDPEDHERIIVEFD